MRGTVAEDGRSAQPRTHRRRRLHRAPALVAGLACALAMVPGVVRGQPAASEGVQLSLAECLRMGLENNLDLVSARKDPQISEQNVVQAASGFDPLLSSGATHSESEQEISNLFSLTESTFDGVNVGVTQNLKFGADYGVTLNGSRSEQSGPLVTTQATYGSSLALTFNMPLLRGRGWTPTTEQLELARGNLQISRNDLLRQAQTTIETIENAYWDVVATRRALGVSRRKLARAQELLDLNRKKVEVGTLAPIEITQAEAGVASSEEAVIIAEETLENAEDELLRLLAVPEGDPMWAQSIRPTDEPSFARSGIDLQQALDVAMDRRPEMQNARQSLRNSELSRRAARNAVRPGLDLALSATPSGNNFETTLAGPDGIIGTADDNSAVSMGAVSEALSEIPDLDNLNWSAGVSFSIPIRNRRAKASYAIASLNLEKAQIGLDNQEQAIRVEVRRQVRGVESGIKRVDAARANVVLQRKKLDAERKKFENGMSTSFEVLTFQNDLADAELSEIRAVIDYNKALAALERAKGTLLEARGLSLAE